MFRDLLGDPRQRRIVGDGGLRVGGVLRGGCQGLEPGFLDLQVVLGPLQFGTKPGEFISGFGVLLQGDLLFEGQCAAIASPQLLGQLLQTAPAAAHFRFFLGVDAIEVVQAVPLVVSHGIDDLVHIGVDDRPDQDGCFLRIGARQAYPQHLGVVGELGVEVPCEPSHRIVLLLHGQARCLRLPQGRIQNDVAGQHLQLRALVDLKRTVRLSRL